MQICRRRNRRFDAEEPKLEGAKLLLVQPLTLEIAARGVALIAIDSVGAGVGERVLVVIEGKAAGDALGRKAAAVDAAVIGIVDGWTTGTTYERGSASADGAKAAGGSKDPEAPLRFRRADQAFQPLPLCAAFIRRAMPDRTKGAV
jgi:ethanolamine utilization protein EutN